jgi:cytochrome c biogenesis protein
MTNTKNSIWRFFASVKLALATLIILAITSIIGTLIKQGQPETYYVEEYGSALARLFEQLSLTEMYSAWWFVALLCLFAANLVVCSIERLPGVWRQMKADNLALEVSQLASMGTRHQVETRLDVSAAAERLQVIMAKSGWSSPRQLDRDGTTLLAAQKGAWSRLGVYIVHLSILIVLGGAIIGSLFGFQAYVFIPEGTSSSNIYLRKDKQPIALGYELQCDWFEKSYYPNGMIKQYRADLTVIDPEREAPFTKSVIVNDPLSYRGLTFYVGDGFPMEQYFVVIRNQRTGTEQAFRVVPELDVPWKGSTETFRIDEVEYDQDGNTLRAKFRFGPQDSVASPEIWIKNQGTAKLPQQEGQYELTYRQLYSTLLLVTKDPGVMAVYFGFCLMVLGLVISFFMSHRRIWVYIAPNAQNGTRILAAGSSNKHKPSFARRFDAFIEELQKDPLLSLSSKKKKKK